MGLDVSHFEAPHGWPCMSWSEDAVRRFLDFVKRNDDGSLRITKWGMVERFGKEKLQDIANLFAAFEEAGESSVSSLQLAVALVLCNQHAAPDFKASQCFMLFDWAEDGVLNFYDILCLLQACTKALAQCMHSTFQDVGRDDLERLCHSAMTAASEGADDEGTIGVASVKSLTDWALADPRTASILMQLSPPSARGASPSPLSQTFTRFGRLGAGEHASDGGAGLSRLAFLSQDAEGLTSNQPQSGEEAGLDLAQAMLEEEMDPLEALESSLLQGVSAGTSAGSDPRFARNVRRLLHELQKQLQAQAELEDHLTQARSASSPGVRARELDLRWGRLLGEGMVLMRTSWTAPLDCAPFLPAVAPELLQRVLKDWAVVQNACLIQEVQLQVAQVASTRLGTVHMVDSDLQATAQEDAASQLLALARACEKVSEPAQVRSSLHEEITKCIDSALPAARALQEVLPGPMRALQDKKQLAARLEGALAYLAYIAEPAGPGVESAAEPLSTEGANQLAQLRSKAGTLLTHATEDVQALEVIEASAREHWQTLLTSCCVQATLRRALRSSDDSMQEVLETDVRILRSGGLPAQRAASLAADAVTANSLDELACTARRQIEEMEQHWLRTEGAMVALRALARGQSLRYELELQKTAATQRVTSSRLALVNLQSSAELASATSIAEPEASSSPAALSSPGKAIAALERLLQATEAKPAEEAFGSTEYGQLVETFFSKGAAAAPGTEAAAADVASSGGAPASGEAAGGVPDPGQEKPQDVQDGGESNLIAPPPATADEAAVPSDGGDKNGQEEAQKETEAEVQEAVAQEEGEPAVAAEQPKDDEGSAAFEEEVATILVPRLRELRFRRRAFQVAVCVVQDFLLDGTMAGLDGFLRQKLEEVTQQLTELEESAAVQKLKDEKLRALYVGVAQGSMEGVSTAGAAAAAVKSKLFEMYESILCRRDCYIGTEPSRSQGVASHLPPLLQQPCLHFRQGSLEDSPVYEPACVDSLDHVKSARHAQLAYLMGSMLGVTVVELAAAMTEAWAKPSESGEREMTEDLPVVFRLAELVVELKLVQALSEHHLLMCNSKLTHLAAGLGGLRASSAAAAAKVDDAVELSCDISKLCEAAEGILAEMSAADILQSIELYETDGVLSQQQALLQSLHEGFLASDQQSPVTSEFPAIAIAPMWEWWRSAGTQSAALDSIVLNDIGVPEGCAQWSKLVWKGRLPAYISQEDQEQLSKGDMEGLQTVLQEHSKAFRLWTMAHHRLAVLEAVARKSWDSVVPRATALQRLHLVEVLRREALSEVHVGTLSASQQACVRSEMGFLHTLRAEHAHAIDIGDLEQHRAHLEEELSKARAMTQGTSGAALLTNLRQLFPQSLDAAMLEGLQDGLQAWSSKAEAAADGGAGAADTSARHQMELQVGECAKLQASAAGAGAGAGAASGGDAAGASKAHSAHRGFEEKWGVIRAIDHVRSCLVLAEQP